MIERGLRERRIPFGSATIAPDGRLQLEDGVVFNMAGFSHVVPNAVSNPIEGGPSLPLAPLPRASSDICERSLAMCTAGTPTRASIWQTASGNTDGNLLASRWAG